VDNKLKKTDPPKHFIWPLGTVPFCFGDYKKFK
jgi:hypothetical protein